MEKQVIIKKKEVIINNKGTRPWLRMEEIGTAYKTEIWAKPFKMNKL